MGSNLNNQVLEFDGSAWRTLEVKLTSTANGESTTVSQEFAAWLKTLNQVLIKLQKKELKCLKSPRQLNHQHHAKIITSSIARSTGARKTYAAQEAAAETANSGCPTSTLITWSSR